MYEVRGFWNLSGAVADNVSIQTNEAVASDVRFARSRNVRHVVAICQGIADQLVRQGVDAVILPGMYSGDHVIVGAGAVVTHSFPGNCTIGRVPATIICFHDETQVDGKQESQALKMEEK